MTALLVSRLETEEPAVVELLVHRLESIRASLAADPELGPRLREPRLETPRRFGTWRDDEEDDSNEPDRAAEHWSDWLSQNRDLLAAADREPVGS